MLDLGHVLFGGRLFREGPGEHELRFENRSDPFDDPVKSRRHPRDGRMLHQTLDISDCSAAAALIPTSVEVLGGSPKLHDEVAGEIFWAHFSALLAPEPDESCLIGTHDDPGIRAPDETAPGR